MLLPFNILITCLIIVTMNPRQVQTRASNSLAIPVLVPYNQVFILVGLLLDIPLLVLIPVSFALRYREGSILERQQMKWLALFGGIEVVYVIFGLILYPLLTGGEPMNPGGGVIAVVFYSISSLVPPLAIGIAILRYRLWQIDLIIRCTIVYSTLTVTLALIYFGSILILQTIFTRFFNLGSGDLAIVISTLAIVVAFTPLRSRIQRPIDQRFYRQKYNFDQINARFADTTQTQVELEPLAGELLSTIEDSVHPERLSLWLVSAAQKK
jgi:hypothetical protein